MNQILPDLFYLDYNKFHKIPVSAIEKWVIMALIKGKTSNPTNN